MVTLQAVVMVKDVDIEQCTLTESQMDAREKCRHTRGWCTVRARAGGGSVHDALGKAFGALLKQHSEQNIFIMAKLRSTGHIFVAEF